MKQQKSHWSVVLDIIEAGVSRNTEKAINYALLLAQRLEDAGDAAIAERIRRTVQTAQTPRTMEGMVAPTFSAASASFAAPLDAESRNPFIDEFLGEPPHPPILPMRAREEVARFIRLRQHIDTFLQQQIPVPRSMLLYGPPGCGKNTIARYVAAQIELPLLVVRLDSVMSSYLGTTAKNVRMVFEAAARRPGVLFLDEFDAIAKMRDDANEVGEIKRIVNSLIQNMDAFPQLLVIAATNHEHLLDPAIWRRFDLVVALPLPGYEERLKFFAALLPTTFQEGEILPILAEVTRGSSGADIEQMVTRALQEQVLNCEMPLEQILTWEIWRYMERRNQQDTDSSDNRTVVVTFIDQHTHVRISARLMSQLTGVPGTTIAHIRQRTKGEGGGYER